MKRNKIFLDTSILITALLSSRGGSFYILTNLKDVCDFQINQYVFQETLRVLEGKFISQENLRNKLFLLLGLAAIKILSNPSKSELKSIKKIISRKDTPILVSALENSDYLLTLDKEFFSKKILEVAKSKNLLIKTPREFIQIIRKAK